MKKVKVYRHFLLCPICKEEITSKHRHDFRHCKCGECFVDGGLDYFRFGYGDKSSKLLFTKAGKMSKKYFRTEEV